MTILGSHLPSLAEIVHESYSLFHRIVIIEFLIIYHKLFILSTLSKKKKYSRTICNFYEIITDVIEYINNTVKRS